MLELQNGGGYCLDIRLHHIERGSGAPLILLHGNGESLRYFKYQYDFFAPHVRVIGVDTRGHGSSPRGGAPFTLEQFAEDLKDFMDEMGIPRAHILGFSDGGNIALLFALKYPGMVSRLILNGANLTPSGVKASAQAPVYIRYGKASLLSLFDKKAVRSKELLGLMARQPQIRRAQLASLKVPVLVIAGKNDMIKDSHTRSIAAAIPEAQLCILEGDHFVARRNSGIFNQTVLDFLQKEGSERKERAVL